MPPNGGHDRKSSPYRNRNARVNRCSRRLPVGNKAQLTLRAMQEILDAIQSGASGDDIANLKIPQSYRAAFVRRDETAMFEGVESAEKDPTKSIHIDEVPTPELAPDEVYLAVMASSINFNTVWTSIFEPLAHVRVPRPPRPRERVGERATSRTTTSLVQTHRVWCCGLVRQFATGSRATE